MEAHLVDESEHGKSINTLSTYHALCVYKFITSTSIFKYTCLSKLEHNYTKIVHFKI